MISLPATYISTAPIINALQLNKKNDKLYKLSIPFSYQLTYRYFYGFDLQFDEDILKASKGDISTQIKDSFPNYVVFITIQQGQKIGDKKNKETKGKSEVEEPKLDVNRDIYAPIRES